MNGVSDRLVTIASSYQPANLHILKGLLETEGVECFVADENFAQGMGYTLAVGGARLQVRECDAANAKAILSLEAPDCELVEEAHDTPEQTPPCPECGSDRTVRRGLQSVVDVALLLVTSAPGPDYERPYKCRGCGHRFRWKS